MGAIKKLQEQPPRMAVSVSNEFDYLLDAAKRRNTQLSYQYAMNGFRDFAGDVEVNNDHALRYLVYLANTGAKWSTILATYHALKHKQKAVFGLEEHLKGLKNLVQVNNPIALVENHAPPASFTMLKAKVPLIESDRDKLIVLLLWWGALRVSEVVNLCAEDFVRDGDGYLMTIRSGKNIDVGDSLVKSIQRSSSHPELCPVDLLTSYLNNVRTGYLFPGVDGSHISTRTVQRLIPKVLGEGWTTHSLRHGILTEASRAGVKDVEMLRKLSGHKSVQSLTKYIHTKPDENNAVNALL